MSGRFSNKDKTNKGTDVDKQSTQSEKQSLNAETFDLATRNTWNLTFSYLSIAQLLKLRETSKAFRDLVKEFGSQLTKDQAEQYFKRSTIKTILALANIAPNVEQLAHEYLKNPIYFKEKLATESLLKLDIFLYTELRKNKHHPLLLRVYKSMLTCLTADALLNEMNACDPRAIFEFVKFHSESDASKLKTSLSPIYDFIRQYQTPKIYVDATELENIHKHRCLSMLLIQFVEDPNVNISLETFLHQKGWSELRRSLTLARLLVNSERSADQVRTELNYVDEKESLFVNLINQEIKCLTLKNIKLNNAIFINCRFTDCDFRNVDFSGAILRDCILDRVFFENAYFEATYLDIKCASVVFDRPNFTHTDFRKVLMKSGELGEARGGFRDLVTVFIAADFFKRIDMLNTRELELYLNELKTFLDSCSRGSNNLAHENWDQVDVQTVFKDIIIDSLIQKIASLPDSQKKQVLDVVCQHPLIVDPREYKFIRKSLNLFTQKIANFNIVNTSALTKIKQAFPHIDIKQSGKEESRQELNQPENSSDKKSNK